MNKASVTDEKTSRRKPLLEVIACSLADAVAAEQGGADRLEIISHFEVGGLTPPLDLVRAIIAAVRIPVRVMLRESEPFQIDDAIERQQLCHLAAELAQLPVDGLVCGFLRGDRIDHELLAQVLRHASGMKCTFHRAFEELSDSDTAISELRSYPQVDRILTSGGTGSDEQKMERLKRCAHLAAPEITILAGGNLTESMALKLRAETDLHEFHVGRVVRMPETIDGTVSSQRVREFISTCLRVAES